MADNNINKNSPDNPPDIIVLPAGFPSAEETLFYKKKQIDDDFFRVTREEKYISEEIQKQYGIEKKSGLPVKLDDLDVQGYKLVKPCRVYGGFANRNKLLQFIKNDCRPIIDEGTPLRFYLNANAAVRYFRENEKPRNILSVLRGLGTTEKTRTYLKNLGINYDYPKPVGLIQYLMKIGCEGDGTVLDFFAGSGTTGEAVLASNRETGSKKRFILVQLPESTQQAECQTIADIAKERMRRVIKKTKEEHGEQLKLEGATIQDQGFRVFKLADSNFKTWHAEVPKDEKSLTEQLELHINHVRDDRTPDDLLYEILLKSGFLLTTKVEKIDLAGKTVYSVAGGAFLICLDLALTLDAIRAMADKKPERVVCLDQALSGNDQLKANAVQIFKTKGVTRFKTV